MSDTCRSCGRKILWGVTAQGKRIPLDAIAPVYHVLDDNVTIRSLNHYVTHFATCPDANKWSRKGKATASGEGGEDGS